MSMARNRTRATILMLVVERRAGRRSRWRCMPAWLHVMLRSRSVCAAFTREPGVPWAATACSRTCAPTAAIRATAAASMRASSPTFGHLVLIPWLLSLRGCVEAYKVPKGSGNPVVAMVKMVKPKKKKKKTLSLRPNSAILFEIPDLDDTEVDQVMEEQTQATYQASANAKAGKMGKGGGNKGGWPEGMDDYKIRFIRLEHGGAGWDDGMDETGADINFLRAFAQATGFKKIASKGESHSIALLRKYPNDGFPPFVYLTGNADMGRVSAGGHQDPARVLPQGRHADRRCRQRPLPPIVHALHAPGVPGQAAARHRR